MNLVETLNKPVVTPAGAKGWPAPDARGDAHDGVLSDTTSQVDRLSPFRKHVALLRWGTLGLDGVLLLADADHRHLPSAIVFALLGFWTVYRTIQPLRHNGSEAATALLLLIEMAVASTAVIATGGWNSPFTLALLTPVVVGGFLQGSPTAVGLGMCSGAVVTLVSQPLDSIDVAMLERGIQWTGLLMLVALVVGFGHHLLTEATGVREATVIRMGELTEANRLLTDLHRVVQRLPSSLDLADVLRTTTDDLRSLTGMSIAAVLLYDPVLHSWSSAHADGATLPLTIDADRLPSAAQRATTSTGAVLDSDTAASGTSGAEPGLSGSARSAAYVGLRTRGDLIGLLLVEDPEPGRSTRNVRTIVEQLAGPAAVAIDNARWFGRIRSVAADEERVRIARDLHDRIGQSLALIGFEVDRITRTVSDPGTAAELQSLRAKVRAVVGEVRETLYDIRTDVTEDRGMSGTLDEFLARVAERSSLEVHLDADESAPLPVRQEREMWHIAQEAVVNVERHASARNVWVRWRSDGTGALLEVCDDGVGFAGATGRVDSYGMRGLRERAAAIGGRLEIESRAGQGTVVRCRLIG